MILTSPPCQPETFWFLLHDRAHWEFEMFLMLVFDGLIGALLWPFVRRHLNHHLERDRKEARLAEGKVVLELGGREALHLLIALGHEAKDSPEGSPLKTVYARLREGIEAGPRL